MCNDFTPAQKALHGMTQDVRKEYGEVEVLRRKLRLPPAERLNLCVKCVSYFLLYCKIVPKLIIRRWRRLLQPWRCRRCWIRLR